MGAIVSGVVSEPCDCEQLAVAVRLADEAVAVQSELVESLEEQLERIASELPKDFCPMMPLPDRIVLLVAHWRGQQAILDRAREVLA